MADTKVPAYQVKHIDGVMHLTLQANPEAVAAHELLRVQPPASDFAE